MHELSLAMSVVDIATEECGQEEVRVVAVHLRIGAMVGIVPEVLRTSFDMAAAGTPVEGARLVIVDVPAMIHCARCGGPRRLESLQWFGCPDCGTPSGKITQGREVELTGLELES